MKDEAKGAGCNARYPAAGQLSTSTCAAAILAFSESVPPFGFYVTTLNHDLNRGTST